MTPQEINERIAKLCGWEKKPNGTWVKDSHFYDTVPPRYSESLDLCRVFEHDLPLGYVYHLIDVLKMDRRAIVEGYDEVQVLQFMRATSAQRCEAFLRMKGQWE